MATIIRPSQRRMFHAENQTSPILVGAVAVVVLIVLLMIGYAASPPIDVGTNEAATARPIANTAVARVQALTEVTPVVVTPVVVTQVVDRTITVVPNSGFAIVTVTARDGVTVRRQPNTAATAVGQAPVGSDLMVIGSDVLDPGGSSRWIPVRYQGIEGYVRSDLVDRPHAA